jgi:hypothetical protein
MTETTMAPVAADEAPTDNKRNPVFIAGGLAAVLALAGGGYLLLGGGGSDSASVSPLPLPRAAAPVTTTVVAPKAVSTVKKPTILPAATKVSLGRDPFIALYVQPAAAAGGSTGTAATTPTGTTGTTTTTPTSTGGTTGTASTGSTTPTLTTSYPVVLKSIVKVTGGGRLYTFAYGGVTKKVLNGQRFGKYGELVVLGNTTNTSNAITGAILQVGDDEPVTIALGEKLTVK